MSENKEMAFKLTGSVFAIIALFALTIGSFFILHDACIGGAVLF